MPMNIKAKLAYGTFSDRHKADEEKKDKMKANLELVEGFELATKEAVAVHMTQEEAEGEPDPHMLSLEDNINLTQNVLGYNRRGRYPLHGVGATPGIRPFTGSSMASTAVPTTQTHISAMPLVLRVSQFLRGRIDSELHVHVTKEMSTIVLRARTMDEVMSYIIGCLAGVIPADLFGDVIGLITSDAGNSESGRSNTQAGDGGH